MTRRVSLKKVGRTASSARDALIAVLPAARRRSTSSLEFR